jgi:hypothetical protein
MIDNSDKRMSGSESRDWICLMMSRREGSRGVFISFQRTFVGVDDLQLIFEYPESIYPG